ncbi:hypothetical protein PAMP_010912 [Pampus punctatissimus]
MAQPSPSASPGVRRRSDGSVRECLVFPVSERNEQERLEAMVRRRAGGAEKRGAGGGGGEGGGEGGGGGGGGGGEARDHLDNRPKRWTWGGPPDGVEGNPKTPPCPAIGSAQHNELPAASSARQPRNGTDHISVCRPPTAPPAPPAADPVSAFGDFLSPPASDQPLNKQLSNSSAALHSPERESPGTPTGRSVGGTTDAEEASRLLAERRRLARIQKEQEERQRQEEDRLRAEEEQKRQQEAREQQERAVQQAEEERVRREEERRSREEEERRQKEQRWKDMQDQLDREREEAILRAQREAERKRQEREQLHIQEEQERLQRKKRIEEIMKRTRKSEVDTSSAAAASDVRAEAAVGLDEDAPTPAEAPVITLGPLENKSFVDELSDGVQSMDVSSPSVSISPVSRDEQASAQEFSPVTEGTDGCPLEHLMDLDAHGQQQRQGAETPSYPKLQAGSGVGDLNKNLLIQAYSAASESSQLIQSIGPRKLDV